MILVIETVQTPGSDYPIVEYLYSSCKHDKAKTVVCPVSLSHVGDNFRLCAF